MNSEDPELRWRREDGSWIFGGVPVGRSGREFGLALRMNLLKRVKIGKKVLSVGCAVATELYPFFRRDFIAVGIDPERKFLLEGKMREHADCLILGIGESIPLKDNYFDLVLLFDVLEHVIKPELVLREIKRVLKANGLLFLTVPNKLYPFETHGVQICQKQIGNLLGIGIPFFSLAPNFIRRKFERARVFSEKELVALLRKYDFEPLLIEYMMPPLDILKQTSLIKAARHFFLSLNKVPLIKKFGATLMIISKNKA